MDMSNIINQMLVILILMMVGVAARKLRFTDDVTSERLTKIVLNIAQTGAVLASVMNAESTLSGLELLWLVAVSFITYAILIAVSLAVPRIFRVKREERGLYSFMTIFGNVGFTGFPIVAAIFGPHAVFYAAMFNMPFGLIAFSYGIILISGPDRTRPGFKQTMKLLFNGPVIATFVAMIIFILKLQVPAPIASSMSMVGALLLPSAMLIIGGALGSLKLKEIFSGWRVYAFSAFRLVALPVIIWSILRLFVTNQEILGLATVITSMPVAAISTMFSIEYGGNVALASRTVLMTSILSVITIPLVVYLLLV